MNLLDTIALQQFPNVGKKTAREILSRMPSELRHRNEWKDVFDLMLGQGLRIKQLQQSDIDAAYYFAEEIIELSFKKGIEIIHYENEKYPVLLANLSDAPLVLYSKGDNSILNNSKSVAIIGTREPTEYGFRIGKRISTIFSENNYLVVSGLAKGCDTAAHEGSLESNGKTVAVLPGDVEKIYPKENYRLANLIVENGGLLISEYPIGQKIFSGNFIERDRIQSGLSEGVIVVETDVKGGTLHTVKFAKDQRRQVAAISSHPEKYSNHEKVQGNKKLLKEGIAMPIRTSEDIANFMSLMDTNVLSILRELQNSPLLKLRDSFEAITKLQSIMQPISHPVLAQAVKTFQNQILHTKHLTSITPSYMGATNVISSMIPIFKIMENFNKLKPSFDQDDNNKKEK